MAEKRKNRKSSQSPTQEMVAGLEQFLLYASRDKEFREKLIENPELALQSRECSLTEAEKKIILSILRDALEHTLSHLKSVSLLPNRLVEESRSVLRSTFGHTAETPGLSRRFAKRDEAWRKTTADREQVARELFGRIQQGGWTCGHCGAHGVAEKDFRLSIGPDSCVICRRCGWHQE